MMLLSQRSKGRPALYIPSSRRPSYTERLALLGGASVATILPLGDITYENEAKTTFRTVGAIAATFTYSEARTGFDNPISYLRGIPLLNFNGTDEEADTPDADDWSRVETAPFSIGAWVNPDTVSGDLVIFGKWAATSGAELREYRLFLQSGQVKLSLYDESANVEPRRISDGTLTTGQLAFVVVTYTGDGGADAAGSVNIYLNGALNNGTAVNNASYVVMENLTVLPTLAYNLGTAGATDFFDGKIVGAQLGPFFVKGELSAAQVAALYAYDRRFLGV